MNPSDVVSKLKPASVVKQMSFADKAKYGSVVASAALDFYCSRVGLEWREGTKDEDCSGIDAVLSDGRTVQVKSTEHTIGNLMIKQWYLDTKTKATYHPDVFNADLLLLVNQYGVFEFSRATLIPILRDICLAIGEKWRDEPGMRISSSYQGCDLYFYRDDREKTRTGKKRPVLHARVSYKLGTKLE